MSVKDYNKLVAVQNKAAVREVENQYVNSILDNLDELVEKKREEITNKLISYNENHQIIDYAKDGTPFKKVNVNPLVLQNYFLKSLNPLGSVQPAYSPEKLAIVWELYYDMIGEINMSIGNILPSLTSFCNFAGITLSTFRGYKNSSDENMRTIAEKIDDICFDNNITMAQFGNVSERSTIFRMKSEQERVEKERPIVHLHAEQVDLNGISKRLKEIKSYNSRKSQDIIDVTEE